MIVNIVVIHLQWDFLSLLSFIQQGGVTLFDYSVICINLVYLYCLYLCDFIYRIDLLSCYDDGFNQDLSLNCYDGFTRHGFNTNMTSFSPKY